MFLSSMSIEEAGTDADKSSTALHDNRSVLSSPSGKTSKVGTQNAALPLLGSNPEVGHEGTDYAPISPKSLSIHRPEMRADNVVSTTDLKPKKRSKHKQHKFAKVDMTIQRTRDIILSMLEHR